MAADSESILRTFRFVGASCAALVAPRDLSLALGRPLDPTDPVLRPAFERVWALCAEAGKPFGVHATDGPTARLYRENGCRLVTVVNDNMAIKRESAAGLAEAKG